MQTLILEDTGFAGQFRIRKLFGATRALTDWWKSGGLEALQNLNQLTELNLRGCKQLTGQ